MDAIKAAAANLLRWLDQNTGSQVMSQVQARLSAECAGAPVSVALDVDLMALVCEDVELATLIMQDTSSITTEAQAMINQQLAYQAAETMQDEQDPDLPVPLVRLALKITQAPLPLHSPSEVYQHTLSARNHPTGPSQSLMVSCLGVVVGLTPPVEQTYSCRFMCPACGSVVDVLAGEQCLPCCNIPVSPSVQEDLSGRVMIPTQQLWISELSSAAGRSSYSCSRAPMLVHVPEHSVGTCQLGCIVHMIGHSSIHVTSSAGADPVGQACNVLITASASSITPLHPHFSWTARPGVQESTMQQDHSSSKHHLQDLWELTSTALGCQDKIDPYVALGMLLSAVAVGGRKQQQAEKPEQVNVLFLHDPFSPCTTRLLQSAAELLSPQSVFMPMQQAEHVNPITKESSTIQFSAETTVKPVYASILHLANTGIAVADLSSLASKAKQHLLTALQQRATPHKDVPHNILPPMTATCWASAAWQDIKPAGAAGEFGAKSTKLSTAAAKMNYSGFDLCLGDGTAHEGDALCHIHTCTTSNQQDRHQRHGIQQATECVRQIVGGAVLGKPPKLSAAAQTLLGNYFLVLRQSLDSSNKMSKPALLASLIRVASAAARLQGSSEVLEQPDATLAVLLMEQTISNKLGDAYHSLLELPADLHPSNGRSLDDQIALLHGILVRTFKQLCCSEQEMDDDDDDDDSGSGGLGCDGDGEFALPDSQVDMGA